MPDWSLTGDQLRQALSLAQARGMQRFDELEVDSNGHVEIEGYDANQRDLDLDLRRDALTATGETR